jgi:hypothetical protein
MLECRGPGECVTIIDMALLATALLTAVTASPHAGSKPHLVFLLQDVRALLF